MEHEFTSRIKSVLQKHFGDAAEDIFKQNPLLQDNSPTENVVAMYETAQNTACTEMNSRERVLAMMAGQPVDRLPVMPITMMFAADQIGVPYRQYATDYRVLVEAQLVTAERFGFDYVSAISDPAREAADCGVEVRYFDNQPPALDEENALLADKSALARLRTPDPLGGGRMTDRVQAVALFKQRTTDRLIEGWVEGPCTEGADLRGINTLMLDFLDDPGFVRDLFAFAVEMELRFAGSKFRLVTTSSELVTPQLRWLGRKFTRSSSGRLRSSWWTVSTRRAVGCGYTFAGTRARCWPGWAGLGARLWTWITFRRWPKPGNRWGTGKSCSAIFIPSLSCATARRRR